KADLDEEWAKSNPIRINVSRSAEGLKIIFTPNLKNDRATCSVIFLIWSKNYLQSICTFLYII
ncbi:MAG: hypothetical protein IKM06_05435, partial [Clostridia bacterium]|nr:hypothetical protein [Clostridia bacterium]